MQTPPPLWIICLCADWCGLCKDYQALFSEVARLHPEWRFAWVDIEDQAALVGDMEIETFPTLLVADEHGARFFGTVLPHASTLERLLLALSAPHASHFPYPISAHALLAVLPSSPAFWVSHAGAL